MSPKFALLTLLLLSFSLSVQAQQKFGYVLDIRGDWLVNGSAKLSKGSALNVDVSITPANPSDTNSYIVVADRTGNIFDRRNCGSGECAKPIKLPTTAIAEQSFVSRLMGAAMALVSSEPAKYSSFVSRGADLREAVVKLSANQVDLQEVFKNMQGDKYLVRFEPIGKKKPAAAVPTKPMAFSWDPQKPAPLDAPGLKPGLYRVSVAEVSLLESEGGSEPTGNEAWVLVTTSEYYSKAVPSFVAAQNVTRQWGSNVKQTAVREFLRASLDFLTAQGVQ